MTIATLAPTACAGWCEAGDGHIYEASLEDQICVGASRVVPVSADAEGGELTVYEVGTPGAVSVALSHNERSGPTLTMDEVRALRDVLDAVLSAHAGPGLYAA